MGRGSLEEGRHRRVSAYKGLVDLDEVVRTELLGDTQTGDELPWAKAGGSSQEIGSYKVLKKGRLRTSKSEPSGNVFNLLEEKKKGGETLVMGISLSPIGHIIS